MKEKTSCILPCCKQSTRQLELNSSNANDTFFILYLPYLSLPKEESTLRHLLSSDISSVIKPLIGPLGIKVEDVNSLAKDSVGNNLSSPISKVYYLSSQQPPGIINSMY